MPRDCRAFPIRNLCSATCAAVPCCDLKVSERQVSCFATCCARVTVRSTSHVIRRTGNYSWIGSDSQSALKGLLSHAGTETFRQSASQARRHQHNQIVEPGHKHKLVRFRTTWAVNTSQDSKPYTLYLTFAGLKRTDPSSCSASC